MAKVTIRYWAAAKEAAGVQEESVEAITLSDLLNTVVASRKPDGRLATSSRDRPSWSTPIRWVVRPRQSIVLDDGAVVEVLPPFAGG